MMSYFIVKNGRGSNPFHSADNILNTSVINWYYNSIFGPNFTPDGRIDGELVTSGVYFYVIKAVAIKTGEIIIYKGTVTIMYQKNILPLQSLVWGRNKRGDILIYTIAMQQNNYINIANLTPYKGGYGVYTARVMLDFDPDNNDINWRMADMAPQAKQTTIRVFPNPAKDVLYIEVMNTLDSYNAIINIYNTIGQLVAEQQMTQKMEFINLKTLKTGMYIYNISYDNGFTEKGKFIIQQ